MRHPNQAPQHTPCLQHQPGRCACHAPAHAEPPCCTPQQAAAPAYCEYSSIISWVLSVGDSWLPNSTSRMQPVQTTTVANTTRLVTCAPGGNGLRRDVGAAAAVQQQQFAYMSGCPRCLPAAAHLLIVHKAPEDDVADELHHPQRRQQRLCRKCKARKAAWAGAAEKRSAPRRAPCMRARPTRSSRHTTAGQHPQARFLLASSPTRCSASLRALEQVAYRERGHAAKPDLVARGVPPQPGRAQQLGRLAIDCCCCVRVPELDDVCAQVDKDAACVRGTGRKEAVSACSEGGGGSSERRRAAAAVPPVSHGRRQRFKGSWGAAPIMLMTAPTAQSAIARELA